MRSITKIIEIITKLEKLYFIRLTSELPITKTHKVTFEREERKIRKQFDNKKFLTQCLSTSKTTNTAHCLNSRISCSLFCYKHQQSDTKLYSNEVDFLFKNLTLFINQPEPSDNTKDDIYHNTSVLTYKEFCESIDNFRNQQILNNFKRCHKRFNKKAKINESDLIPEQYLNIIKPLIEPKQSRPRTRSLDVTENQCYARISTGRQCTNHTYRTNKDYCSIHLKKMRYGDIREDPPEVKESESLKKKKNEQKTNENIIQTLPDVIKYLDKKTFQYKNNYFHLINQNTLKIIT